LQLGRLREAESAVLVGSELCGDVAELELVHARLDLKRARAARALARLRTLTPTPGSIGVEALSWTAVAELALGRPDAAALSARRALELDRSSSVAAYALAVSLDQLGDPRAESWKARVQREAPGALDLATKH
jgi:hypothetical protein